PKLACPLAAVLCSMRLRGVFNYGQSVLLSNRSDAVHLCRHSIQMDGDNRFGTGRDGSFEPGGVHRAADRIDIHKDWRRADIADGPCGCDESHRHRDDFVFWTDIEATQRKMQRARAAVQAYTVSDSTVLREFCFEICCCWSLSKSGRFANCLQCRQHFAAKSIVLRMQI